MADETAQLLVNLQAQAKKGFPYIFISPKRLEKIQSEFPTVAKGYGSLGRWNAGQGT